MQARPNQGRLNGGWSRERTIYGELHLIRRRLDDVLSDVGLVIRASTQDAEWSQVEEAGRIAARGVACALAAVPPPPAPPPVVDILEVGELRIDRRTRRQWYAEREVELTPLLHRLLVTLAAEPTRLFSREDLLHEVWGYQGIVQTSTVIVRLSKLRRALVEAGAPCGELVCGIRGIGWSLLPRERAGEN